MQGKDDGIIFVKIRDNHIEGIRFSLKEEELLDICNKQNTLQLMIALDEGNEELEE